MVTAAEPSLVLIDQDPGRFEVSAIDPAVAHRVGAEAAAGWRLLSQPLDFPDRFSSALLVRAAPFEAEPSDPHPAFRVTVEIGGIVSLRLRPDATLLEVRRALVQGWLMRLAVAHHGVDVRLTSPVWLEQACVGWWQTHAEAAQLDALKYETARLTPPTLESLLLGQHGAAEPRAPSSAAVWLLAFLQGQSGRAREWPTFVLRLLAGDDPLIALVESYPGRFSSGEERELWWRTGYHHVRRLRTLPALDAAESQAQLGALARFVFASAENNADRVVPLAEVVARAREPLVSAELTRRARELAKLASTLHPFYRNAGLSLAEVFSAGAVEPPKRALLSTAFEQDWREATELETASAAALDRLERGLLRR